jgi:gamma-glutamyltranspeptidase/glutathione hydrolase
LAREGYAISQLQHDLQVRELDALLDAPARSGARYYLKNGTEPYQPGDLFRQPDLAALLDLIARRGPEAFYQGDVAAQIDADMRANDGLLRADDLALIPWPVERPPLSRRYRGYLISTMPPPGAGRTLLLVLLILNHLESRFVGGRAPVRYHFVAEAFRKAFLQRKDRPFDPNSYPQIRDKKMLSRQFAREIATSIADSIDVDLPLEDWIDEGGETTHFSVMDGAGNAVSMTQSIELVYGAKVAAAELGFLYNNYMQAFERSHPAHPYYLRPNATPWSTAAPTLIFRRKEPWLALGSPGSERIFSTLAQFIIDVVDGSAPLCQAATEPRFHCSPTRSIWAVCRPS